MLVWLKQQASRRNDLTISSGSGESLYPTEMQERRASKPCLLSADSLPEHNHDGVLGEVRDFFTGLVGMGPSLRDPFEKVNIIHEEDVVATEDCALLCQRRHDCKSWAWAKGHKDEVLGNSNFVNHGSASTEMLPARRLSGDVPDFVAGPECVLWDEQPVGDHGKTVRKTGFVSGLVVKKDKPDNQKCQCNCGWTSNPGACARGHGNDGSCCWKQCCGDSQDKSSAEEVRVRMLKNPNLLK